MEGGGGPFRHPLLVTGPQENFPFSTSCWFLWWYFVHSVALHRRRLSVLWCGLVLDGEDRLGWNNFAFLRRITIWKLKLKPPCNPGWYFMTSCIWHFNYGLQNCHHRFKFVKIIKNWKCLWCQVSFWMSTIEAWYLVSISAKNWQLKFPCQLPITAELISPKPIINLGETVSHRRIDVVPV